MIAAKLILLAGVVLNHFTNGRSTAGGSFKESSILEKKTADTQDLDLIVCKTKACYETAQDILDSLDPYVDPCKDFYSFACGGWILNHSIPPTETYWDQYKQLKMLRDFQTHKMLLKKPLARELKIVKAAKKMYNACLNTKRIETRGLKPLIDLLNDFNQWPMVSPDWNENSFHWEDLVSNVGGTLGINIFLEVSIDIDPNNASRNAFIINKPPNSHPKHFDLNHIEPYMKFVTEVAELVSRAAGHDISPSDIYDDSLEMVHFENYLARILEKEEKHGRNASDSDQPKTIQELQNWTDERNLLDVNWMLLLFILKGNEMEVITEETPVVVNDLEYLSKLLYLVDATSPRILANYILWRVVREMSRDLTEKMLSLDFEFRRELELVQEDEPRWKYCVSTIGSLHLVIEYMYVFEYFSVEEQHKAAGIVEDVKTAFKKELSEASWMDDRTKIKALEKADALTYFIGYPNGFGNVSALEAYYEELEVGNDHFENMLNLKHFLAKSSRKPVKDIWRDTDPENPVYCERRNSLLIPAGFLQRPFFHKDQPEALNYGSIGAIVGHEMTHGFDYRGAQRDKFGNTTQWWSKKTEKKYLENAQCFINQYRSYRIPELDVLLNAEVTVDDMKSLDENIAGNRGLAAALRAYETHKKTNSRNVTLPGLEIFTPEQLFYIGFARTFCKSHTTRSIVEEILDDSLDVFRVNRPLSNLPHFASSWNCPLESLMNPAEKCKM